MTYLMKFWSHLCTGKWHEDWMGSHSVCSQTRWCALLVNDLAQQIKHANLGVKLDDTGNTAVCRRYWFGIYGMLKTLNLWCTKWRIMINQDKTQIMHFRKKRTVRSIYDLSFGAMLLKYTCSYKYIGFLFDEYITFEKGIKSLSDSACSGSVGSTF
jgi:hypothetical protein